MSLRLFSGLAALTLLTGCGQAALPHASGSLRAAASDYAGSYLALCFEPSPDVSELAGRLRHQLGFVDLMHAVPPRRSDELHVTVGYFKKLAPHQAEQIAREFRGQDTHLVIDGYGVANRQVAYFTVQGADTARATLRGLGVAFSADDPHITFGVHPGNPRDVHGVSKKLQHPVTAQKVLATYHFKQGARNLW